MVESEAVLLFVQLALVLGVARALGRAARRVGIAPVIGELLTGFVIGPSLLGAFALGVYITIFPNDSAILAPFATVGLVFLLVLAGIETDLDFIRRRAGTALSVASGGIVLPFALGFGLAWVLPATYLDSSRFIVGLFLAVALSISAVPVTARILADLDATRSAIGQLLIAAAMVTDIVGWLLLALVVEFAMTGRSTISAVVQSLGLLAVFGLGVGTVGLWSLDAVLHQLSGDRSPTVSVFSIVVVATVIAVAVGLLLGIEAAISAFVAGIALSRSAHLDQATVDTLEVVTLGLFAPIFFGTAGLQADLTAFFALDAAAVALVIFVIAVAGKFAGAYVTTRSMGYSHWEGVCMGAGLNARGAIEIIIATIGLSLDILSPVLYTAIVLVAILTSMMASPLLRWGLQHVSTARPDQTGTV